MGKIILRYISALGILLLMSLEVGFMRLTWAGYSIAEIPEVIFSAKPADRLLRQEAKHLKKVERGADQASMSADLEVLLEERYKDYAIYYLRPELEEQPYVQASRQQQPASMIKLFIMAKAMEEVKAGNMSLEEPVSLKKEDVVGGAGKLTIYDIGKPLTVKDLITLMIQYSDNTATNTLITKLGMGEINAYLEREGYQDTKLNHKMMLQKVETLEKKGKRTKRVTTTLPSNLSSVQDVGTLLTRIYKHECVGEQEDAFMAETLKGQEDKICFNAALPDWQIAHKTGEYSGTFHDGGIFYGPEGDFILVIFCEKYAGRQIAIEDMQEMAWYFASRLSDLRNKLSEENGFSRL